MPLMHRHVVGRERSMVVGESARTPIDADAARGRPPRGATRGGAAASAAPPTWCRLTPSLSRRDKRGLHSYTAVAPLDVTQGGVVHPRAVRCGCDSGRTRIQ